MLALRKFSEVRDGLEGFARRAEEATAAELVWFSGAAYRYLQESHDEARWRDVMMPAIKGMVQALIAGKVGGATMGDDGLLTGSLAPYGGAERPVRSVELNLLWYNVLMALHEELSKGGDRAGDHFDRLAGRFRRAFAKAFWCDQHRSICSPEEQGSALHDAPGHVPDGAQLLAAVLPFSPLPNTKRVQLVEYVGGHQPAAGVNWSALGGESVKHLAWLAEGHVWAHGSARPAIEQAASSLAPLEYAPDAPGMGAHPVACAEVLRVLLWLRGLAQEYDPQAGVA